MQMEQSQTQSTPSKALHKRGSKQTQQQSANVHKAAWNADTVWIFLELVIKEAVCKSFQKCTNKVHDVKQLQNKYALLKKDWQLWSKLMDNRHGPTGISYNEATGLIQASDDWWAHYEKVDKNAIKFKTKSLEHMDLMRRVYEGAMATRKYAWTPGAAFESIATDDGTSPIDEEDCEDSSSLPPFQPAAQCEDTVHHRSTPEDDTSATVHAASSAINTDDTLTSASPLASSMENLASSVKLQQREVRVRHDYGDSTQDLIDKCMRRLYSLERLDPQDPLIVFGLTVLDNLANQAIMVRIPTDAAVISWLRMKKSQSMGCPSAANSRMGGA
ncbi:unnamed protein product [Camellia sinensis]